MIEKDCSCEKLYYRIIVCTLLVYYMGKYPGNQQLYSYALPSIVSDFFYLRLDFLKSVSLHNYKMKKESGFKEEIDPIISVLQNGGVILYPTDTIWGLGCDATNEKAIEKIFRIKNRSRNKSMIILAGDAGWIDNYTVDPSMDLIKMMKEADSPTTGIFPSARNLPVNIVNRDGSIAIRIPADDFCIQLLTRFGKPIVSTSANISQQSPPQNFSEISPRLISRVDYTVFYKRSDTSKKYPSHIIRLDNQGKVERIR